MAEGPIDLPTDEIHVWCCDTRGVSLCEWEQRAEGVLDAEEWKAVPSLAPESGRVAPLAGRLVLRHLLSRYARVPPGDWRFERTELGRPLVVAPALDCPLHFSVSHTKGLVSVALARFLALGVDAEREDRSLMAEGLARRHCAPREQKELEALEPGARGARLLRFWTLKEAFAKARGSGLRFPLARIDFADASDRGRVEARIDPSLGEEVPWHFHTRRWQGEYRISLAWQGEATTTPQMRELSAAELGEAAAPR